MACTDSRAHLHGRELDGVPIVGGDDRLQLLLRDGVEGAIVSVGATGDNTGRAEIFERVAALGFVLPVVCSPSAVVAQNTVLGAGTVVLTGAIVGAGAHLGHNVVINTAAVIEHDCLIGSHAHIASAAVLGGAVTVGEGAHVGLGAAVRQGARIGAHALVGAGAVVVGNVRDGAVAMGVPARERREKVP